MCRQAWFPPGQSARDAESLVAFLDMLERRNGGHGNGAGWVDPAQEFPFVEKGVAYSTKQAAELITKRPLSSWGIFHTRIASCGEHTSSGCHPHVAVGEGRIVVLTHNGTWSRLTSRAFKEADDLLRSFPSDSAVLAAYLRHNGWEKVVSWANQTIVAAIHEDGKWSFRAYKNTFPLVRLANGGVASEGGSDEFKETGWMLSGDHDLANPRVTNSTYNAYRNIDGPCTALNDDTPSSTDTEKTQPNVRLTDLANKSSEHWMNRYGWHKPEARIVVHRIDQPKMTYSSFEEYWADQKAEKEAHAASAKVDAQSDTTSEVH